MPPKKTATKVKQQPKPNTQVKSTPPTVSQQPDPVLVDPLQNFHDRRKLELQDELSALSGTGSYRKHGDDQTIRPSKNGFAKQMLEHHLVETGRGGEGGPNQGIRNIYAENMLHRMENAVNEEKLRKAGVGKGLKSEDLDNEMLADGWESVSSKHGLTSNWAHFAGRHGAPEAALDPVQQGVNDQKAKGDQVSRVLAGVNPDEKHKTPVDGNAPTTQVQVNGSNLTVPNYTHTGKDIGVSAGGFSSHSAQLFAIEEAYAQGWNRKTGGKDQTPREMSVDNTFDKTTQTKGKGKNAKVQSTKGTGTEKVTLKQGKDRFESNVTLPQPKNGGKALFEGGFGTSYFGKNKVTKGGLTPSTLKSRAKDVTEVSNQQSAKVILDGDSRGGFTVQTAYPTNDQPVGPTTTGNLATDYTGEGTKAMTVGPNGSTTSSKKQINRKREVIPAVTGSGLDDEQQLQQSLARIPSTPGTTPTVQGNTPTVQGNTPTVQGNTPTVQGNTPTTTTTSPQTTAPKKNTTTPKTTTPKNTTPTPTVTATPKTNPQTNTPKKNNNAWKPAPTKKGKWKKK